MELTKEQTEAIKDAVESGSGTPAGAFDLKAAIKRGRGRPKGSGGGVRAEGSRFENPEKVIPVISLETLKALYAPEAWGEVAALPFSVAKIWTGSEAFDLSKEEKTDKLGAPLALVMQTLIQIDPRYVALTVLLVNMTSLFAEKVLTYALEKKEGQKD